MGFNSFINHQFNDAKFYVTTSIAQPDGDWNNSKMELCEQPMVCISLREFYQNEIDDAIARSVSWSSGIKCIAKLKCRNVLDTGDITEYLNIRVDYSGSQLSVTYGYGTAPTSFYSSRIVNKSNTAPLNVYLIREQQRSSYAAASSPNWYGDRIIMIIDSVSLLAGTWNEPSSSYPNGHMVYDFDKYIFAYEVTNYRASPCNDDDSTRADQSSEAIDPYTSTASSTGKRGTVICMGLDDNYDPDDPGPNPPEPTDPNDEGDPSGPSGGDGDHTPVYDPVPIPNKPTMGSASAGFVTMYKLGLSVINQFAGDMFASNVWEAIKLFFSNPMDFLVGCMLLPFEPHTGSSYRPKFGAVSFANAYPAVDEQYKDIDCGVVQIDKYWGSCFDYEPYTKIQIWLPYIGYRDLPVDEIMGMSLGVKYRVDCLTGDCVAFVSTGVNGAYGPEIPRVIAQFYGNCGVRVPFGSVSFDAAVAASINLMGAAATTGLSPGANGTPAMQKGEGGKAYEGIVSPQDVGLVNAGVSVVSSMKPNVQKGGAAGASSGYMSIQTPYLIRRIPRQNLPGDFMKLKGYPANISGTLADFTGVAVVDNIQLNNIPAMETEREEIMQWLSGGVII